MSLTAFHRAMVGQCRRLGVARVKAALLKQGYRTLADVPEDRRFAVMRAIAPLLPESGP